MSAKLKPGETTIIVKGKGDTLDLPAVSSLVAPLTVQLRRAGGGCWGARFSSPSASGPTLFKAKSD